MRNARGKTGQRLVLMLLFGLLLAGCARPGDQSTPVLMVGSTPGKALATIWLSPTPVPSPASTLEPTLTPAPTLPLPTLSSLQATLPIATFGPSGATPAANAQSTPSAPVNCSSVPEGVVGQVWQSNLTVRQRLGCPTGEVQQFNAASQAFEHGFMFWFEAGRNIYVLSSSAILSGQQTDTWWRLQDTFSEEEPALDESITPPDGLLQPQRGFGKVWRNNGFVREAVGWAVAQEVGYRSTWVQFEAGWMMTSANPSQVFVMIPSDEGLANIGVHLGPQSTASP